MNKKNLITGMLLLFLFTQCAVTEQISYSTVSAPEEGGIRFEKITDETRDEVIGVFTRSEYGKFEWWVNPRIAVSPDGKKIAYLAYKNKQSNIMIANTEKAGSGSTQRTFRDWVTDLSWSPDGEQIYFSEERNRLGAIYCINATVGSVLNQLTFGSSYDSAPVVSGNNLDLVFFARRDYGTYSIWSYNKKSNLFTNYSNGCTPEPVKDEAHTFLCTRFNEKGLGEIWKVNYQTGIETLILSMQDRSFTTPKLSPDGQWIVCMGNSFNPNDKKSQNLDIFVVRADGTRFTQLTFHKGTDGSPIWSPDGKSIYFLSQRGTAKGYFNVWRMNFNLR